jgi:hypothetical protein
VIVLKTDVKVKENSKKKSVVKDTKPKKNKKDEIVVDNNKFDLKKYLTKDNITYFTLLLFDIVLVIYLARQNIVNYAVVMDEEIFVSKTKYLLWGRNYVNVIVIAFFYVYTCLVNKFFLKKKNTKKFLLWLFGILVIINVLLFVIFTKRVY